MNGKPLWRRFAEMTPEEIEAEEASDLAHMRDGTMNEVEARERAEAWEKASEWRNQQAVALRSVKRLADATGCPKDVPLVRWLIDKGLLVEKPNGYDFTEKARVLLKRLEP